MGIDNGLQEPHKFSAMTIVTVVVGFRQQRDVSGKGRKEMLYLMTHSTHFIYGYMAS